MLHETAEVFAIDKGSARHDPFAVRTPEEQRSFDLCRLMDLIIASGVLIFILPMMIVIACAIFAQDGGPIFYGQQRVGYKGRTFRCWKFRSMVMDAEVRLAKLLLEDPAAREEWARDYKLRRDPRITALGNFLRTSSFDELPQVWNVLKGEMSIVGPRPIVVAEVPRYRRWFREYCSVRPGITGLWQVSGRNDVSYNRRVALDRVFSRRRSPSFYVWIVAKTVPAVLMRSGSY